MTNELIIGIVVLIIVGLLVAYAGLPQLVLVACVAAFLIILLVRLLG